MLFAADQAIFGKFRLGDVKSDGTESLAAARKRHREVRRAEPRRLAGPGRDGSGNFQAGFGLAGFHNPAVNRDEVLFGEFGIQIFDGPADDALAIEPHVGWRYSIGIQNAELVVEQVEDLRRGHEEGVEHRFAVADRLLELFALGDFPDDAQQGGFLAGLRGQADHHAFPDRIGIPGCGALVTLHCPGFTGLDDAPQMGFGAPPRRLLEGLRIGLSDELHIGTGDRLVSRIHQRVAKVGSFDHGDAVGRRDEQCLEELAMMTVFGFALSQGCFGPILCGVIDGDSEDTIGSSLGTGQRDPRIGHSHFFRRSAGPLSTR